MKKLILMIILTLVSFVVCNAAIIAVVMKIKWGPFAISALEDVVIKLVPVLLFQLLPACIMYKRIKLNERIHKKIFWIISVGLMLLTAWFWVVYVHY